MEGGGHVRTDWASNWALKSSCRTLGQTGCGQQKSQRDFVVSWCVFHDQHRSTIFFGGGGAMLGFHCCVQAFSSHGTWGPLFIAGLRLLIAVASLVAAAGCR